MLQSIFVAVNTLLIAALSYCIVKLSEAQSEYKDEQRKQGWHIFDLEQEKYAVRGRLNDLEREVNERKMLTMIMLVADVVLMLMLIHTIGELTEIQDEQDDRLDALEDYADYLRNELMNIKVRMNAENDRADNYVHWRRRIRRASDSD